jgi:hypothetical protein
MVFIAGCGLLPMAAGARADDVALHEYIPAVEPDEAERLVHAQKHTESPEDSDAHAGAGDSSGGDHAAESSEESEPFASAPLEHGTPAQSESFRPDRLTSLEGGLDYFETFTPAIAPFKRGSAFDAVRLDVDGKTPVLGVRDLRHRVVPNESLTAGARDARPRDRFVGELDLEFHSSALQPLPSVSPESRILGVETKPPLRVQIERDGADNYFIRALGEPPAGPVRVRFQTDAPRSYFGSEVPRLPLRELPSLPRLEPSITKRALRFAGELGITEKSDLRSALERLTAHFRGFTESVSPPTNTGDLYLDLARGRKGLCRHRAYGFVVTARALGIAARYVQNEAHAWVEVEVPNSGWLRIDLGGATHGLTAHNAADRPSYTPAQPDTLPRPAAYQAAYARAAQAAPERSAPDDPDSLAGRWLPEKNERRAVSPRAADGGGQPPAAVSGTEGNANANGAFALPELPGKAPLHIALDDRRISALRGGQLVLTGRLYDDAEHGVPGLRVEIWIAQTKRRERMLLAVQVTDADGYFRAPFGVPADLDVGDYKLIVRSEGDATHLAVTTE